MGSEAKRGVVFFSFFFFLRIEGSVVWNALGDGTQTILLRRFAVKQSREMAVNRGIKGKDKVMEGFIFLLI